jgi:hypothetical protein
MTTGMFAMRKRMLKTVQVVEEKKRGGTKAFFNRHLSIQPEDSMVVESERQRTMQEYDKLLKAFR